MSRRNPSGFIQRGHTIGLSDHGLVDLRFVQFLESVVNRPELLLRILFVRVQLYLELGGFLLEELAVGIRVLAVELVGQALDRAGCDLILLMQKTVKPVVELLLCRIQAPFEPCFELCDAANCHCGVL